MKPFSTSAVFMSKNLSYRLLLTVTSLLILQGLGGKKKLLISLCLAESTYSSFQTCMATSGLKAEFDPQECFWKGECHRGLNY